MNERFPPPKHNFDVKSAHETNNKTAGEGGVSYVPGEGDGPSQERGGKGWGCLTLGLLAVAVISTVIVVGIWFSLRVFIHDNGVENPLVMPYVVQDESRYREIVDLVNQATVEAPAFLSTEDLNIFFAKISDGAGMMSFRFSSQEEDLRVEGSLRVHFLGIGPRYFNIDCIVALEVIDNKMQRLIFKEAKSNGIPLAAETVAALQDKLKAESFLLGYQSENDSQKGARRIELLKTVHQGIMISLKPKKEG